MSNLGYWLDGFDGADAGQSEPVTGRLISLRFLTAALARRRRVWIGLAVVGLLIGAGYHVVKPLPYWGTATLYLAHPPGSDDATVAANDLALVRTIDVGKRAVALLGEPGLSPLRLLGTAPATEPSENILVLKIAGPSPAEAVRRVNAVTEAYLTFRSAQYDAQNEAVVTATQTQIAKFQSEVGNLTRQIDSTSGSEAGQLANLISQRSGLDSQIATLQQTVQSDDLAAASISDGSRVVTTGTLVPSSRKKPLVVDGVTGLVGGLSAGLILVSLRAVTSDLLWRREDIAGVLGAPVELSVPRSRRRRRGRSLGRRAAQPDAAVASLMHFLYDRLATEGPRRVGLVVALDDARTAGAGVAALAGRLRGSSEVTVVDATAGAVLGKALGVARPATGQVRVGDSQDITLVVPPLPWQADSDDEWWERMQAQLADADVVLVVATVDPAYGAAHLARWARQAVVTVTAGRVSAARLNVVGELMASAGVPASSAVLFGAERSDESIGLPDPANPPPSRPSGPAVSLPAPS